MSPSRPPAEPAWTLSRGASVEADGSVRFSVWAPAASRVAVCLTGPGALVEHPLTPDPAGTGLHSARVAGIGPGTDYLFRLDDARDRPDPVSRHQPHGVHGASRVVAPHAFRWTDGDWRGCGPDPVLYELHVGTFTPAGTFDGVAERLPYLRDLGVTAIELMPVAEFPGGRNWGYDGVFPYAPQSTYGGPEGLRRLVDAAHAHGIAVVLDVVYNHLGPEGNYLPEFGPYFTDRYRTPWGAALNFDGPDSDEVRQYVIDNARYWVSEFHLDGLRLDATHQMFDLGARHVLEELASATHAVAASLGRRVLVMGESDLNSPRFVLGADRGGFGFDAQWSDDFHHAIHAALTGERGGYYADFGTVEPVAKALRDGFVLDGAYSTFRRRRHGGSGAGLAPEQFVVFIQNHDQVGNRATGDRLDSLVSFGARKTAAALLLLSPYSPLLFMGEEYGETRPFLYFVSHEDPGLIEAVRSGRRREFTAFGWPGEVPDPAAAGTFEASRLSWRADGRAAQYLALYRDLIALRRARGRPPGARGQVGGDPAAGWVSLQFPEWMAVFNLAGLEASVGLPTGPGPWTVTWTTEDPRYGGTGSGPGAGAPVAGAIRLPAFSALVLRQATD